LSVDAMMILIT